MQVIIDNWIAFLPLVIFIFMFLLWFYKGRDPKTSSVIVAEYEAPDGLSPAEVAELVKFDEPSRGITAEIIQLAVLGYLKINHTDKDYELIRLKDSSGLTKEHQKTLLDGLFSDGGATIPKEALEKLASDFKSSSFVKSASSFVKLVSSAIAEKESKKTISDSVLISDLKNSFYRTLAIVKKQITKALMAQDYFPNNPTVIKSIYASITVFVIFFGFFFGSVNGAVWFVSFAISAIIILIFGLAMPKRTLKGSETYRRILGLKLYLNVAEKDRINFHNAPEKKPEVFEKLLPYAIALGVEKQWAKQFENIYLTPPTWYGDSYSNFNTLVFINSLNNFHSSSSSVLASSPSSRASSGGSGFSGGSSGGGFGGGGGGSW